MIRNKLLFPLLLLLSAFIYNDPKPKQSSMDTLQTVDHVNLKSYTGKWYEIAKIPNRFQRNCARNTTATYKLRDDSRIDVTNRCTEADGSVKESNGIAKVIDSKTNAKLKVSFVQIFGFSLFWGDYWIIGLDDDYNYAIVGTPSRKYGWILARSPELSDDQLNDTFSILKDKGYNPDDFEMTVQRP